MLERLRLSGLSGTYRIRSAELARDKKQRLISVTVLFLDDSTYTFQLEKRAKGSDLLEQLFQHLELTEKDYFGLLFPQRPGDVVRWVDPNKSFKKQWSNSRETDTVSLLEFRVKFFVSDPSRLQEEYTRYQFYLQIKRDIFLGKLPCSLNTQCLLASYTVQSELGNFDSTEHQPGYLNSMQLLAEQNEETERRISELHKLHRGQLPADAEYNYLEHAKRLELYGIDLHKATDSAGKDLQLGVTSIGLIVFQNSIRVNTFSWSKMVKVSFKRKDFFIQLRREPSEDYDTLLGFCMGSHKHAKALWKSCVEHHSFFRLKRPHRLPRFLNITLGSKFYYSGRTELQAVQESKHRSKIPKAFTRSPSKRLIVASPPNGATDSNGTSVNGKNQTSLLTITKSGRPHDNKVTSKQTESIPRKAWEPQSDEEGGFIERCAMSYESPLPPAYSSENNSPIPSDENLITIRLVADEQGRFGFNVKGGVDLKLPVQVSKVVPHTSADRSVPRICEGDHVVMINGRDVNGLKHEQVVSLIRASREFKSGELILTIKPNASVLMPEEEPFYQYVPESNDIIQQAFLDGDGLYTQSLLLLSDGLASGALLTQYELLYRKNPDLAITEAKKAENSTKNRYRDISPYDCTRVTLINSESGDYINANYVNMEIPGGKVNRYIATQGPLASTTTDFWRMVQQESSHLVVMLTTVMEAGRQKCHQYWPVTGEEMKLTEGFSIKCLSEQADETGSFVFREFILSDKKTGERRSIQHMQYLAWPDHCVPSDPNLFLQFTERVRSARNKTLLQEIEESLKQVRLLDADADENGGLELGERKCVLSNGETPEDEFPVSSVHQCISAANPPVIVHCSAGIGRTGVLILMDTALALMESKEPVYPLDIVQTMRDQRPCMVQNVFPHIDSHPFNFPSSFVDDSSLVISQETFLEKIHAENEILDITTSQAESSDEIKCEPIKSEQNDVNVNQSLQSHLRSSRTKSNGNSIASNRNIDTDKSTITHQFSTCFKCEKCKFICVSQSRLDAHIAQIHTSLYQNNSKKELKILCPGCENVFYTKRSLEVHLEYDHIMNKDEIQPLIESVTLGSSQGSDNIKKSRIYLKNVDFLRNPPSGKSINVSNNVNQDVDLIDLISDSHEGSNNFLENKISSNVLSDILPSLEHQKRPKLNENVEHDTNSSNISFYDMNPVFVNDVVHSTEIKGFSPFPENGEKRRRPKIYIKNVDILKEPIFVPTNNFANVLNVNADLSTLALFPSTNENHSQTYYDPTRAVDSLPSQTTVHFNGNNLETHKKKIYIKNVNVLRKDNFQDTPRKSSNSLHLRTVDELNLMNKNEVQNLFTPILDQNCIHEGAHNPSSENSKNSDEVGLGNYSTPELDYNRGNNSFIENEEEVIQMNWSNDYGFDGLENIIDSNSTMTSGDQKNPHFDLNTPHRSIADDHDKDLMFVCAQEIINGITVNIDENQRNDNSDSMDSEKETTNLSFCMNSSLPAMKEQDVVEILDDLEKQQPPDQDDVILIPEKGRIYVADNLMEGGKNSEESRKKSRGRPLGSKHTWVTMAKPQNKRNAIEIGYQCDQNCNMRFLKLETLEIHKKCHVSSSSQKVQCPVCNSTSFTSWDTLHTHLWRSHQIDMDLYSCQHCDFKTPILSRLINTHSKIHSDERNFKCEQCLKSFKNSKQLKNHRRTHRQHSMPQTNEVHRCEACGSTFSQIKSLRGHICKEKVHDRELFSCTICGKVVSNKSSLKQHLLTHEDASKYKCEHCYYVTNDHNAYRRHKITHDKSKMYNCKFCDYKCIQSYLYQKHVLKDHPDEADQVIFKCPTCSFSTINQANYNLHVTKHGDATIQVDTLQDSSNHLQESATFAAPSAIIHLDNNFNSKIKVKSDLVLTDPNRLGAVNSIL